MEGSESWKGFVSSEEIQSVQPWGVGRLSIAFAASLPMNCSAFGSHLSRVCRRASVRHVTFDGARNIPDFEATIKDFARQGYIKDFNFRRQARLQMGVHVLIDHEGSMMAFEHMSDIIAEFVQFVGNKNSTIWYFHNCPTAYIFQDKNHFEAVRTTDWLKMLDEKAPAQVFIFSDAGAARGYKNMERIVATEAFLKNLKKHTFVWLNPMPEKRWKDTAAEDIRRKVRMYDASDREFVTAMQSLKMQ